MYVVEAWQTRGDQLPQWDDQGKSLYARNVVHFAESLDHKLKGTSEHMDPGSIFNLLIYRGLKLVPHFQGDMNYGIEIFQFHYQYHTHLKFSISITVNLTNEYRHSQYLQLTCVFPSIKADRK